jgi:hypothetical protein
MVNFERRKRRRFIMSLPVSVHLRNDPRTEIRGVTRDVSSGGAFVFLQPNELAECDSAELIAELPAEAVGVSQGNKPRQNGFPFWEPVNNFEPHEQNTERFRSPCG